MKMMQSMSGVLLTLFLSFHFLLCHSQNCDRNTQYERDGRMCCMCKPGERLKKHCTASSPTSCERCEQGFYSKQYDTEFTCRKCHDCSMIHLKYTRHCSGTDNAVCECKPGYRCKAQPCLSCEEIPTLVVEKNTTIREAPRHSSEGGVTPSNPHKEEVSSESRVEPTSKGPLPSVRPSDITLLVCCCTLLICVILVSRNKYVLRWIWRTTKGYWVANETAAPNQCTEEEGKIPVQEVCKKLEVQENMYS
ncbi:hypothetical protein COCON_G00004580 [Conger conger]|uniref:TNFR-Cys domain-containing protein n=1 Tax=Conger conger TaxID=82655 RepID=A0A9Q1E1U3_CONCO|nr:CD27 antigen isoform X3 [Conger conger]KAJ8287799.1 hypothetical protein COCON_G00004580 [Conger conger]